MKTCCILYDKEPWTDKRPGCGLLSSPGTSSSSHIKQKSGFVGLFVVVTKDCFK